MDNDMVASAAYWLPQARSQIRLSLSQNLNW
jgi:hypothetical protein